MATEISKNMKKLTAAVILNHNLPVWTDRLYKSLKPYERDDYDLLVFDNGSPEKGVSQYTTFRSEENLYFGGGFHAGMQVVLEDDKYDSMLFVSNDLTIHPYYYVKTLREAMFNGEEVVRDIVAPSFYNVEPDGQCHWKTMHTWGSNGVRDVPFSDFQCPLISKRLLKKVDQLDSDLIYGWGIDTYFAILCRQLGYKIGVLDNMCILHHNSVTVKLGVAGLDIPTYCRLAEEGQNRFFQKNNLMTEYHQIRKEAANYEYTHKS